MRFEIIFWAWLVLDSHETVLDIYWIILDTDSEKQRIRLQAWCKDGTSALIFAYFERYVTLTFFCNFNKK